MCMPERLSNSRNTHESVLCTTDGECRDVVVEFRSTVSLNASVISGKNGTHQNLCLDATVFAICIFLCHNTTKGVTSHNKVITGKSFLSKFFDRIADIVVDQNRLRRIKYEVW